MEAGSECFYLSEVQEGIVHHPGGYRFELELGAVMISPRKAFLLGRILIAFTLSACRVVVDTQVNKDGSGELKSSVVFSAEEKHNFENSPGNSGKTICDNLSQNAPPNTTFVQEESADETFCTTVRTFKTIKELRKLYTGMGNIT